MEDKKNPFDLSGEEFTREFEELFESGMPPLDPDAAEDAFFDIFRTGQLPISEIIAAGTDSQDASSLSGLTDGETDFLENTLLSDPELGGELTADEQAMAAHDLSHPSQPREPFTPEDGFSEYADDDAFAETSAADAQPTGAPPRPVPKGRPRRRKGYGLLGIPHLLATVIWLAIIVVIGTSLGRMIWVCAADVLAFGRESRKVSVTITAADTIEDIAGKLHDAGLIRYPSLFEMYAGIAVDEGEIITGTFELDTLYDYHALVVQMSSRSSSRSVVEDVLIPEGYNCRQVFDLLEEKGICTVAELEAYSASGEFQDFWFLDGLERGDKYCLEGFLFPDTYDFYSGSTPREALGKMLLGFEARIDREQIETKITVLNERLSAMMRANGCNEDFIAENQLDLRDVLIVASMIEEETASSSESPTIASVIYNRLTQDQVYERYLGIDAAIIYATGDANHIDTSIDSPYNTYLHAGLTPGPISNPGLDSINAALEPEDTGYYYYVLNPETHMHSFSKTLEEHEKKVAEYSEYTEPESLEEE